MKAKEIQIGDLLQCDEIPCGGHRIDYISDLDSEIGANGEIYGIEHLFPISITPEILEKNGFEDDKFGYFNKRFRHLCGYHYICIDLKNYTIIIGEMYCPPEDSEECQWENKIYLPTGNICVHHLQHALRLCGLNDLADNFKI